MKVEKLKKLLAKISPNAEVLIPGSDHTYRPAHVRQEFVFFDPTCDMYFETDEHGETDTTAIIVD